MKREGFNRYFGREELLIAVVHNLDVFDEETFRYLTDRHYFFVIIGFNADHAQHSFELLARDLASLREACGSRFPSSNIIMMCNTPEQVPKARRAGFSAEFINHNCWLDSEIFGIHANEASREFDAVINACPATWKRIYLAEKLPRLAYLKGKLHDKEALWDHTALSYAYVNESLLSVQEVSALLNRSKLGLCLSGNTGQKHLQGSHEGAMQASSEYLLCGLPVVSTPSQGGRDVWYDSDNCMIVDPDPDSVAQGCQALLERIRNGDLDRRGIRQRHMMLAEEFRKTFVARVGVLLSEHGVSVDAERHFAASYFHKMIRWGDGKLSQDEIVGALREFGGGHPDRVAKGPSPHTRSRWSST